VTRRFLAYAVDLALLAVALVAFLTGLLVDNLDLHHFALHRWAGYILAVLISLDPQMSVRCLPCRAMY
jgi:hypothetical protein